MMGQVGYTGGAAKVCNDYSIAVNEITYSDWFLPSKDELNQMRINKAIINTTAAANSGSELNNSDYSYWSSTEVNAEKAWLQMFVDGDYFVETDHKSDWTYWVRAVRAF